MRNRTSLGPAIFAGCIRVMDGQTDRPCHVSVAISRIYAMHTMLHNNERDKYTRFKRQPHRPVPYQAQEAGPAVTALVWFHLARTVNNTNTNVRSHKPG